MTLPSPPSFGLRQLGGWQFPGSESQHKHLVVQTDVYSSISPLGGGLGASVKEHRKQTPPFETRMLVAGLTIAQGCS